MSPVLKRTARGVNLGRVFMHGRAPPLGCAAGERAKFSRFLLPIWRAGKFQKARSGRLLGRASAGRRLLCIRSREEVGARATKAQRSA